MTPGLNGAVLPNETEHARLALFSGLVQTLEKSNDAIAPDSQQRFFIQVVKVTDMAPSTPLGRVSAIQLREHAGFLEITPPTSIPFVPSRVRWPDRDNNPAAQPIQRPAPLMWTNLERLNLVADTFPDSTPQGLTLECLGNDQIAREHMYSLIQRSQTVTSIYRVTSRTEWGNKFARCCVPDFAGRTTFHRIGPGVMPNPVPVAVPSSW